MPEMNNNFYELLNTDARIEKLTPQTTDTEKFLTALLDGCEKNIPFGDDDLIEFVKGKAAEMNIEWEGLAESISRRNHEALDKNEEHFDLVLELIRQRTEFERGIIGNKLDGLSLEPLEKIIFRVGLDLMPVIDSFFFKWKIAVPDVVKRTVKKKGIKRTDVAQQLVESDLNDRYAVIVDPSTGLPPITYDKEESYRQIGYAEFFETESKKISEILERGIREMESQPETEENEVRKWMDFFRAWATAVTNTNRGKHEEIWKKVDEEWVKTDGRVIIVHPMEEGYADPIRIMPEVRVLFQLDEARDMIALIKQRMLDWEEFLYSDHELYPVFRQALENTQAGVFITPLYSGEDFDFRFSGQIVPNRSDVRMKGTKIFMDHNSCRNNVAVYRKTVEKYLCADFLSLFDELVTLDTFLYYVIAHECGHSVLMGIDTKEKMGDIYRNVEEYKASHIGLEVLYTMEDRLPERYLDSLCLFIVARIVRFLGKGMRTDKTLEPYFNEAIIQLGTLLDDHFLYIRDGKLHFDIGNREAFFSRILDINAQLKQLYLDRDWDGVRRFREKYMKVDERVEKLFAYLDEK